MVYNQNIENSKGAVNGAAKAQLGSQYPVSVLNINLLNILGGVKYG